MYKFSDDMTEQVLLCFLTWLYYGDYQTDDGGGKILPADNAMVEAISITSSNKKKRGKAQRVENFAGLPPMPTDDEGEAAASIVIWGFFKLRHS